MKLTPRPEQEYRIQRILNEPTKAALIADEPGVGKTLPLAEVICDERFRNGRVLVIGLKDTFKQWKERIAFQGGEDMQPLRRIDGTVAGKAAWADMQGGKPGIFFANVQTLQVPDWRYWPATHKDVNKDSLTPDAPIWKTKKTTGQIYAKKKGVTKQHLFFTPDEARAAGFEPIQESMREHVRVYKKMKEPLDLIVFDEIQVVSNRKSNGYRTLLTLNAEYKVALSGTPAGNQFQNMWAITKWLWPDNAGIPGSFYKWRDEWCEVGTVRAQGGEEKEVVKGEKNPGAFVRSLPCYVRKESDLIAPPPIVIEVDLSPKQREQYDALERDLMVWIGQHPLVADLPITLRQRLRTATLGEMTLDAEGDIDFDVDCASSKLQALGGILSHWDSEQPGMPVVIYLHSKKFARVTVERMRRAGLNTELWSGDRSTKERDSIKARFLAGEIQYLVATISSFSTGLDGFQTIASRLVWMEESESNTLNQQAMARILRPGMTDQYGPFMQVKILARDTHDLGIHSSLIAQHIARQNELRVA